VNHGIALNGVIFVSTILNFETPLFAAEYSLNHPRLDPSVRNRITRGYFEAGHMMYIHLPSLARLSRDKAGFVQTASLNR